MNYTNLSMMMKTGRRQNCFGKLQSLSTLAVTAACMAFSCTHAFVGNPCSFQHAVHAKPLLVPAQRNRVQSVTMNKARGFLIEPAGRDAGVGWNLYQQNVQGAVAIGNRKGRRMFTKSVQLGNSFASPHLLSRQQKLMNLLFDLKEEHRRLDKEVTEQSKSYLRTEEVKKQKKQKLAIKDRILAIESALSPPKHEDTPKLLGEGSSGTVLLGRDLTKGDEVAIKVEPVRADGESLLEREHLILRQLRGLRGFSEPRFFGRQEVLGRESFVLVMDMLGPSLEDLWWATTGGSGGFSPETVVNLGDQMLTLLQALHGRGYLHRDIKPDNFLMSSKGKGQQLHLIDMGVARQYRVDGQNHIAKAKGLPFVGTCRYAPVRAHEGVEQSRRDDVEAVVYTMAFMLRGSLPWDHEGVIDSDLYTKAVGKKKRHMMDLIPVGSSIDLDEVAEEHPLCQDLPPELQEMLLNLLQEIKKTKFEQAPDYNKLKAILRMALFKLTGRTNVGGAYDYDWIHAGVTWACGNIAFKDR